MMCVLNFLGTVESRYMHGNMLFDLQKDRTYAL